MSHANLIYSQDQMERPDIQFALAFEVMLMSRRFRARFAERARDKGQTDARWSALYMLHAAPDGLIQADLAERMGVQGPTLVRLLDALESQGLVSRRSVAADRRVKRIFLEDAGRKMLREIDHVADDLRSEAFADISDADLQTALRVIARASSRLQSAPHR